MWGSLLSLGAGVLLPTGLNLLSQTDAGSWLSSAAGDATEGWGEGLFGKPAKRSFDPATGLVTTTNPDGTTVSEPMNDRNTRGFVNAAGTKQGRAALLEQQENWRKAQKDARDRAELRGMIDQSQALKAFQTYINPQRDRDALMDRTELQEGAQTTRQKMVGEYGLESTRLVNQGALDRQGLVTKEEARQFDATHGLALQREDMNRVTSAANLLTNGYNLALQHNQALNQNEAARITSEGQKFEGIGNIAMGLAALASPRRRYY